MKEEIEKILASSCADYSKDTALLLMGLFAYVVREKKPKEGSIREDKDFTSRQKELLDQYEQSLLEEVSR